MFNKLYNKKSLVLSNGLQVSDWAKKFYEPMCIILNRNSDQWYFALTSTLFLNR